MRPGSLPQPARGHHLSVETRQHHRVHPPLLKPTPCCPGAYSEDVHHHHLPPAITEPHPSALVQFPTETIHHHHLPTQH